MAKDTQKNGTTTLLRDFCTLNPILNYRPDTLKHKERSCNHSDCSYNILWQAILNSPFFVKKKHWYHIVYKVTKVEATSSLKYWAAKPDKYNLHFGVHSCTAHVTRFLDFGLYRLGLAVKLDGSTQIYHKDLYPFGPQCNDAQNEQL